MMLLAQDDPITWAGAAGVMVFVGVCVVIGGAVSILFANRLAEGRMGRNGWAGIRTSATRASDEAWLVAHRVGRTKTVVGGWVMVATALLAPVIAFGAAFGDPELAMIVWTAGLLAGVALGTGLTIAGAVAGHRAAKDIAG